MELASAPDPLETFRVSENRRSLRRIPDRQRTAEEDLGGSLVSCSPRICLGAGIVDFNQSHRAITSCISLFAIAVTDSNQTVNSEQSRSVNSPFNFRLRLAIGVVATSHQDRGRQHQTSDRSSIAKSTLHNLGRIDDP